MIQILLILAAVAGLFGGGYYYGDLHRGNADKVEAQKERNRLQAAVDAANKRADTIAWDYEKFKDKDRARTVILTRKVKDANAASPEWSSTAIPRLVRAAIADAAGSAAAASSGVAADAVRRDDAGPADERGAVRGPGLGDRLAARLRGASSPSN